MKAVVSFENRVRPDSTGVYIVRAFKEILGDNNVEHVLPKDISSVKGGHDLYVKVDDGIPSDWNRNLHPSLYYVIDTHLDVDWRLKMESEADFDFIHSTQKGGLNLPWKCRNVSWNPLGCDAELHYNPSQSKKYDVCFIGNFHSSHSWKRIDAVDALFKKFPNFFYGARTFKDMAMEFSRSKVVFNRSLNNDINMRVFEALCSGSALLTDYIPEMDEIGLVNMRDYFGYKSEKEMLDLCDFAIKNEGERERVAKNGKNRSFEHTYRVRCLKMLKGIESLNAVGG